MKQPKGMSEDELLDLYDRIMDEKSSRKNKEIRDMKDNELDKYSKEIQIELKDKKGKGKINSDPIVEL